MRWPCPYCDLSSELPRMRVSCAVETCSCGVGTFSCAVYAYSCVGDACVWMRSYAFSCGGPLLWGCITLQQWCSWGGCSTVSLPMHTPALFCGKRQGHCYAREFVPHGVSHSLLPAPPTPSPPSPANVWRCRSLLSREGAADMTGEDGNTLSAVFAEVAAADVAAGCPLLGACLGPARTHTCISTHAQE
jgi:hypothetical protein